MMDPLHEAPPLTASTKKSKWELHKSSRTTRTIPINYICIERRQTEQAHIHTYKHTHTYKYYPITPSPLYRGSVEHKRIWFSFFFVSEFSFPLLYWISKRTAKQSKAKQIGVSYLFYRFDHDHHVINSFCYAFVSFISLWFVLSINLFFIFVCYNLWTFIIPPPYHTVSLYCP